jgi:lipoprotein signal peptidase
MTEARPVRRLDPLPHPPVSGRIAAASSWGRSRPGPRARPVDQGLGLGPPAPPRPGLSKIIRGLLSTSSSRSTPAPPSGSCATPSGRATSSSPSPSPRSSTWRRLALDPADPRPSAFVAIGLIASGALGNLHDRFVRVLDGNYGVVDFIVVFYWPGKRWPAFNIADAALVAGVLLFMIYLRRHGDRPDVLDAHELRLPTRMSDRRAVLPSSAVATIAAALTAILAADLDLSKAWAWDTCATSPRHRHQEVVLLRLQLQHRLGLRLPARHRRSPARSSSSSPSPPSSTWRSGPQAADRAPLRLRGDRLHPRRRARQPPRPPAASDRHPRHANPRRRRLHPDLLHAGQPSWPNFNIADMALVVGVALLIPFLMFHAEPKAIPPITPRHAPPEPAPRASAKLAIETPGPSPTSRAAPPPDRCRSRSPRRSGRQPVRVELTGADRDAAAQPVRREHDDRPAVQPARPPLDRVDDLDRPPLRRPGDAPAREHRRQQLRQPPARRQPCSAPPRPGGAPSAAASTPAAAAPAPSPAPRAVRDRFARDPRSSRAPRDPSCSPAAPPPAPRRAADPRRADASP